MKFNTFFLSKFAAIIMCAALFASCEAWYDNHEDNGPDSQGTAAAWNGTGFLINLPYDYSGVKFYDGSGFRYNKFRGTIYNCNYSQQTYIPSEHLRWEIRDESRKWNQNTNGYDDWIVRSEYYEVHRHLHVPGLGYVPQYTDFGYPIVDFVHASAVAHQPCYDDCGWELNYQCAWRVGAREMPSEPITLLEAYGSHEEISKLALERGPGPYVKVDTAGLDPSLYTSTANETVVMW
jgi:hypothetical protein